MTSLPPLVAECRRIVANEFGPGVSSGFCSDSGRARVPHNQMPGPIDTQRVQRNPEPRCDVATGWQSGKARLTPRTARGGAVTIRRQKGKPPSRVYGVVASTRWIPGRTVDRTREARTLAWQCDQRLDSRERPALGTAAWGIHVRCGENTAFPGPECAGCTRPQDRMTWAASAAGSNPARPIAVPREWRGETVGNTPGVVRYPPHPSSMKWRKPRTASAGAAPNLPCPGAGLQRQCFPRHSAPPRRPLRDDE